MSRLTLSIPAFIYVCVLMLLPILSVPFIGISVDLQKGDLAGFAAGLALIVAGFVALFSRRAFSIPFSGVLFLGVPLVIAGIASAVATGNFSVYWWGSGLEFSTVGSLLLFMAAILCGGLLPAAPVRFLQHLFISAVTVAGMATAFSALLAGNTALVSSWPELSAALAAALLCAALLFDWSEKSNAMQWFLLVEIVLLSVLFFFFFTSVIATVLVVFLIGALLIQAALYESNMFPRRPLLSSVLAIIFFIMLLMGIQNPVFSVPPQIRPSFSATEFVGSPVFATSLKGALLGSGPNTFSNVWDRYRPTQFNATPLWNISFGAGVTSIATLIITLGILGCIALLYCIIVFILWSWKRIYAQRNFFTLLGRRDVFAAACGLALFSFGTEFFYTTGLTLFLIGASAIGFAVRMLLSDEAPVKKAAATLPVRFPLGAAFFVAGAGLLWLTSAQVVANAYQSFGYRAFAKSDFSTASADFVHAGRWWATSQSYTAASRAAFELFQMELVSSPSDKSGAQAKANEAIQYSDSAIHLNPGNYDSWLSRSSLYVSFVGAKIPGAEVEASSSIIMAENLAPNRVEAPYLHAVLAAELGRQAEVQLYLTKALSLKSDYAPALQLQKQLSPH